MNRIVLLFVLLLCTQTACPVGPGPNPIHVVVDCVKLEGSQTWNNVWAMLQEDLGNWSKLLSDTEALGKKFGYDTARCVAMELVQGYLSTKQADIAGTHEARDTADKIRAQAGNATFHTKDGDL